MLFRNSGIYILAKIIPGLMAFAALSLYTHYLSPEDYGTYTLIMSGTVLLHNVFFNWLSAGTLRFWSSEIYNKIAFTSTLALSYFKISLSLLLLVSFLIIVSIWSNKLEISWIISAYILLLAQAIFTITQTLFTAKIEPHYYAYLTVSYSILSLILGTLFASLGYGPAGIIAGIALGTLIPTTFFIKRTFLPYKKDLYNKELFKKLLVYGLPFASAALLEEVTKVSDRYMLAWLHDNSQAGLYAVGYDLSGNSILLIMAAINLAAYPVIIKLLETDGKKAAMDYFRHYAILLLGVSIPAVIGLNLIGPDLVYLLIAKQYQESVIFLLPWITVAVFIMGLQATYFDIAFQLGQHVITVVKISVVIAIINFMLNYWLIPTMGIHGAAIATLSSFTIGSVLSAILGRKRFALPFPLKEFIKIVISSLVMGLCLWWLKDFRGWGWLLLQFTVGVVSYLIMMIFFDILDIRTHIKTYLKR